MGAAHAVAMPAYAPALGPSRLSPVDEDVEVLARVFRLSGVGAASHARATRLVRQAGSIAALLSLELSQLVGLGASGAEIRGLQIIGSAVTLSLRRRAQRGPILNNFQAVLDYLRATQGHSRREVLRALFCSSDYRLIADEVVGIGSVNACPGFPRNIAASALQFEAVAVILVHNHPSGSVKPSREDVAFTRRVSEALRAIDVVLADHFIVCSDAHASLRMMGYL